LKKYGKSSSDAANNVKAHTGTGLLLAVAAAGTRFCAALKSLKIRIET
jgi:hypothetical protein